jgi:hypothetical protein
VKLGFFTLLLPNPRYLPLHDLHHTALGAPPTFWGEVEVSAFELQSGTPTAFITLLCVGALFLGALARPVQVWHWLARYREASNLYRRTEYELLLALKLAELRRVMGIDESRASCGCAFFWGVGRRGPSATTSAFPDEEAS